MRAQYSILPSFVYVWTLLHLKKILFKKYKTTSQQFYLAPYSQKTHIQLWESEPSLYPSIHLSLWHLSRALGHHPPAGSTGPGDFSGHRSYLGPIGRKWGCRLLSKCGSATLSQFQDPRGPSSLCQPWFRHASSSLPQSKLDLNAEEQKRNDVKFRLNFNTDLFSSPVQKSY
jgi:hypothetical protein